MSFSVWGALDLYSVRSTTGGRPGGGGGGVMESLGAGEEMDTLE